MEIDFLVTTDPPIPVLQCGPFLCRECRVVSMQSMIPSHVVKRIAKYGKSIEILH